MVRRVDEKGPIQALDRTQPVLPLGPGLPERQTHDYERHGITTVVAALDVAAGDFNGDELPDLAVGHGCNNAELSIRLASTDGTYRLGARLPSLGDVAQIVTTDRNGDAKPDLVIASYSGSSVLAARGTENGEFAPSTCFGFGETARLQIGNLNGDGAADFVVALPYRETVVVVDGSSGRRRRTRELPIESRTGCTPRARGRPFRGTDLHCAGNDHDRRRP